MTFLCPATKKVAGYYVIPSEIFSVRPYVRPSISAPTILLPATPPTVLGQSFSNFTGAFRMVWRYAYCFFRILKLFFITFFFIFNLDFFQALILQKCIGFLPATPPTVLGQSFSNFTGLLGWSEDMHIVFSESWNYVFITFFSFLIYFFRALILQKCIGSMYLLPATPPTVFGQSFSNFTGAFRMVWRYAYYFFRILKLFFITFFFIFNLEFFWALILQKCIGSMYLVRATPPTFSGQSFWNFTHAFRMVWRYAEVHREYVPMWRGMVHGLQFYLMQIFLAF